MQIKTILSGFGGQGVLMMGYAFAVAAMWEDKHVTYMPSYGAEVRGGTANCTVAISNDEIASPIASSPEFIVVMNKPSLKMFQNRLQPGGVLFINSTMIDESPSRGDIELVTVDAGRIAEDIGDMRAANMVMLGSFVKKTNMVKLSTVIDSLGEIFDGKKKVVEVNTQALEIGYSSV
ncbi:MAG: 2-oxoacid:acceptor oxidoreductase family protein [Deltaproteobacteria bacterium]|nr:2-oxoacid:acceptor oxidoreductase family protein [Candidatus Zymogenaceae bacterium]